MTFFYAVEDALLAALAKRILSHIFGSDCNCVSVGQRRGNQPLRGDLKKLCELAERHPVVVMTDLDEVGCPPSLIRAWFGRSAIPEKMFFRIAVKEAEAWVLADRRGFANYLGVSQDRLTRTPETLTDPKTALIDLARRSNRKIREMIVPEAGSSAKIGIEYNDALCEFVSTQWDPEVAGDASPSLRRALARLKAFNNE